MAAASPPWWTTTAAADLHSGNKRKRRRGLINQAKGHAEEIVAFVKAVSTGAEMPIDIPTLIAVTQTTLLIHRSLGNRSAGENVNRRSAEQTRWSSDDPARRGSEFYRRA